MKRKVDESSTACYWFEPATGAFRGSSGLSTLLGLVERLYERSQFLALVFDEDRPIVISALERAELGQTSYEIDYRIVPVNSTELTVRERGRYQMNGANVNILVASITVLQEDRELRSDSTEAKKNDPLTGLLSRDAFLVALGEEIDRRPGCGFALIFLDIDRFRFINDSMGHSAGDLVLNEIAARLSRFTEDRALVARSGSDEFLVVVYDVYSECELQKDIDAIQTALSDAFIISNSSYHLSVSGGIALYPRDGQNVEDLLQSVDAALYNVKQSGGGTLGFTAPNARQDMVDSCTLELELQQAIYNSELVMHYQPVWNFHSDTVVASEALLRWKHPQRGMLLPGDFLPQAEGNAALMRRLGNWVFDQVCAQIKQWKMLGLKAKVWVNVAPSQVHHKDFEADICTSLFKHNVSPTTLGIELTERTLLMRRDDAISALRNLKDMGISIALDDFGVEYSSLSYVHHLPIDTLKIDQTFVAEVETDRYDKSIIHTIVSIASELGLSVTAEGVEMRGQYRALKEMGCHSFQGWLYSPALLPGAFADLVKERGRISRTGS